MWALVLCLVVACTKAPPTEPPPAPVPTPTPPPGPRALDAGLIADAAVVDAGPTAIPISALALAGPALTLEASCQTARPCGFTELDAGGNDIKPPTEPDCTA